MPNKVRWLRRALLLLALLVAGWGLLPRPALLPPGLEFSRVVLDRNGQVLYLTLTSDGKYRLPAHWDELSPELLTATLEMEDRRFFSHSGADPRSLLRAAWGVLTGRKLGGGSTLTMQFARLRWQLETRSTWGKLTQIFRALQLERHYSKQHLAEAYFTCAPYGGNVEGAAAASWRWCGKPAGELTMREAASLSVIPQSPTTRRPRATGNVSLAAAQARLMTRLRAAKGEPPSPLDGQFQLTPAPVPRLAPHWSLRQLAGSRPALVVPSTLDLAQQTLVEQSLADYLARWRPQGLDNAAALLLHAPTREVRAYVGSADFWNEKIGGQVDGVRARRSPGSALKPFIYALAFQAGLIQPHTLLDDAPRRFAAYNPENSDRDFLGPIAASEALRRSRNVPAVALAERLPDAGLEGYLRSAGVALARRDYGLALAIGGAEVSLEELAGLYAGLADPASANLTPATCYLTLDALRGPETGAPAGLAWKTGTSNGFRDAWACGVLGDYVLVVWMGHFNGQPMPGLFARQTAAPLLWQTITRLGLHAQESVRPAGITEVAVCSVSGDLVGPHCPHACKGLFIGGVSPITSCHVHQEIFLDVQGQRVATADESTQRKVCECWSAERLAEFRYAGFPRANLPSHAEDLSALPDLTSAPAPRIISPQPSLTYLLRANDPSKNTIPLEAHAAPGVRRVHWFAGPRYLGSTAPAQPLLWAAAVGRWKLQVLDDAGRSAQVALDVRAAQ